MKKSIITLAVGAVLLGTLSVPSLGFAEQTKTSANISSETSHAHLENAKWVTGIKGVAVTEFLKVLAPTSIMYRQGDYEGEIIRYSWRQKNKNEVYPLYQGLIYHR
ncbi:hypothetical protein C5G87_17090 [Paenibacillus peoriae]|uniref:hypothetical protein n=1 Tax=Paenibacillus peoriae TaxID=59893 RepID=UPI000CEC598A|nr:hypothetical protein [Paenibacillus peoriae]PPQ47830.1 hypothetical protein C5G87_17090 [Paenibacillus peoriae]